MSQLLNVSVFIYYEKSAVFLQFFQCLLNVYYFGENMIFFTVLVKSLETDYEFDIFFNEVSYNHQGCI